MLLMLSHVIIAQNICLRDYPVQLLFRRGESVPKTGSDIFKLRKVLRLKVGFHPPVSKADSAGFALSSSGRPCSRLCPPWIWIVNVTMLRLTVVKWLEEGMTFLIFTKSSFRLEMGFAHIFQLMFNCYKRWEPIPSILKRKVSLPWFYTAASNIKLSLSTWFLIVQCLNIACLVGLYLGNLRNTARNYMQIFISLINTN